MPYHSEEIDEDRYKKKYRSEKSSRSHSDYRTEIKERYIESSTSRSRSCSRERDRTRKYERSHAERSSSSRRKPEYEIPQNKIAENTTIGVFGLSVFTSENKIREIFEHYGDIEKIHTIIDAKTKKSRGFCFIYYEHLEDAIQAKEHCDGMTIDERKVRVDYSVTTRPHSPTPGYYLGRPTKELRAIKSRGSYSNGRSFRGGLRGRGSIRGSRRGGPPPIRLPRKYRSPPTVRSRERYERERNGRSRERSREKPYRESRHRPLTSSSSSYRRAERSDRSSGHYRYS